LQEFIDWFRNEHKLDVTMVSSGVSMLWSNWTPPAKVCPGFICLVRWLTGFAEQGTSSDEDEHVDRDGQQETDPAVAEKRHCGGDGRDHT
jgi:hypothetical protein